MRVCVFVLLGLGSLFACSGDDSSTGKDSGTSGDASSAGDTSTSTTDGGLVLYGSPYQGGQYNLGPVDYTETQFHNACAPGTKYASGIQSVEGTLLAGLWDGIPDVAQYCDACIFVKTDQGKSAVLRVVTYGATSNDSIDVSPDAYAILNSGEYPRAMTWQLAECPASGPMMYEFQTGSSEWWTSLWLRNARVPLSKVEVQSVNHAQWVALDRGTDGTLTDNAGFGKGPFSIRATGVDGSLVTDSFAWPSAGVAGQTLTGAGNFP